MSEKKTKKLRFPKSKGGKVLFNLIVTLIFAAVHFYLSLPALNFHSGDFYAFVLLVCLVYIVCAALTSGFHIEGQSYVTADGQKRSGKTGRLKEYLRFIRQQCLPIGILLALLLLVAIGGKILSLPIFRASAYQQLLDVQTGDFTTDVTQISFTEIPTLDRTSAEYLGDRQMGTLSDMVSQFEYSNDSTQINYQGRPVRVAPIDYADLIKWLTNRGNGLPAYVIVDMVTQEANVVRLTEGMRYANSEHFGRNILRHLRFGYPTFMFSTPEFEIDENGHPWWIAPRIIKRIGLFGGTDIKGAVLVDAVTGESEYMEEVPTWVDTLYTPDLIMQQYDYHGTYIRGFWNSIFGQREVTVTTDGYNYIAMNDDVYVYTGVTSANADQSNLGFLLSNLRTKQTHYYSAPGATEDAARRSAMGVVQDLGYTSTFPLLLNIGDEPTYFIPMLDANSLVKTYAMVNVAQYQIVAIGNTVPMCEKNYIAMLTEKGILEEGDTPDPTDETSEIEGVITDLRSAVISGNTWYYLQLGGSGAYYAVSAAESPVAVLLNGGERVSLRYLPGDGPILTAQSLTIR